MSTSDGVKIGWKSAAALVVANMIGTGVFTSLGYQLSDLSNSWSITILWILGGFIAIFGAFSYAEVGAVYPKSGGEYYFLTKLYSPVIGYLAGWISLTVGFAAPVALACMALGAYVHSAFLLDPTPVAVTSLVIIGLIHSFNLKQSERFQNSITFLKIALCLILIVLGLSWIPETIHGNWDQSWKMEITTGGFAVALIYVTYSYTGWNAASYIVDELKDKKRTLPKALISGTLLVTVIYVLLHLVFLIHAPGSAYQGKIEVGEVFATFLFGENGGKWMSTLIGFFLISSISAMVWVGPRVSRVMGDHHQLWHFLSKTNSFGIPVLAIWFQVLISVLMIVTGTFEAVLLYCGFILQISSALVVFGSFLIRRRNKTLPFKSVFHPIFPILFLMMSAWILFYLFKERPMESLAGMINIFLGFLTYQFSNKMKRSASNN